MFQHHPATPSPHNKLFTLCFLSPSFTLVPSHLFSTLTTPYLLSLASCDCPPSLPAVRRHPDKRVCAAHQRRGEVLAGGVPDGAPVRAHVHLGGGLPAADEADWDQVRRG